MKKIIKTKKTNNEFIDLKLKNTEVSIVDNMNIKSNMSE